MRHVGWGARQYAGGRAPTCPKENERMTHPSSHRRQQYEHAQSVSAAANRTKLEEGAKESAFVAAATAVAVAAVAGAVAATEVRAAAAICQLEDNPVSDTNPDSMDCPLHFSVQPFAERMCSAHLAHHPSFPLLCCRFLHDLSTTRNLRAKQHFRSPPTDHLASADVENVVSLYYVQPKRASFPKLADKSICFCFPFFRAWTKPADRHLHRPDVSIASL